MNLLQKVQRRIGAQVLDLVRSFGLEISIIERLDLQIRKLQFIVDPEARLRATEELVRQHSHHPKPHLELAKCLNAVSDLRVFEQLDRYGEIRREWLVQTGLAELDMEFVWAGIGPVPA